MSTESKTHDEQQYHVVNVYEREATFGSYVVAETTSSSHEFALVDSTRCHTGRSNPHDPINVALSEAGYESMEAHA